MDLVHNFVQLQREAHTPNDRCAGECYECGEKIAARRHFWPSYGELLTQLT